MELEEFPARMGHAMDLGYAEFEAGIVKIITRQLARPVLQAASVLTGSDWAEGVIDIRCFAELSGGLGHL
jgi:hypothetical protein